MKTFMSFSTFTFAVSLTLSFVALASFADTPGSQKKRKSKIERVGGDYYVKSIDQKSNGVFLVVFESEVSSGKFDTLKLESDHLHVGVEEGQKLRLSAEILSSNGKVAEVSQVLLFLPETSGPLPVWLLSRKIEHRELQGARYIEMHAPQSDYRIF